MGRRSLWSVGLRPSPFSLVGLRRQPETAAFDVLWTREKMTAGTGVLSVSAASILKFSGKCWKKFVSFIRMIRNSGELK